MGYKTYNFFVTDLNLVVEEKITKKKFWYNRLPKNFANFAVGFIGPEDLFSLCGHKKGTIWSRIGFYTKQQKFRLVQILNAVTDR